MGYATPADVPVTDDYAAHLARDSAEPGTDYATPYGTDLRMAGAGVVSVVDHSPSGGEGRRVSVDLDDGRRVSYIHLSVIVAVLGQRVGRDQRGLIWSGGSGWGENDYYDPHVHVSLWERPGLPYAETVDFEHHTGGDTPPPAITQRNEDEMYLVWYGDTIPEQGWLMTSTAQVGVRSERDYGLLKRVIDSDQSAATPAHFNYAERDIINGYLRELATTTAHNGPPTGGTPDTASLVIPAWVGGIFLGLIGVVELVRFIVDLAT